MPHVLVSHIRDCVPAIECDMTSYSDEEELSEESDRSLPPFWDPPVSFSDPLNRDLDDVPVQQQEQEWRLKERVSHVSYAVHA